MQALFMQACVHGNTSAYGACLEHAKLLVEVEGSMQHVPGGGADAPSAVLPKAAEVDAMAPASAGLQHSTCTWTPSLVWCVSVSELQRTAGSPGEYDKLSSRLYLFERGIQ